MKLGTVLEVAALATAIVALQAGILFHGIAKPLAIALDEERSASRPSFEESIEVRAPRPPRG